MPFKIAIRTVISSIVRQTPREAVLWLAVHHQQRKALELFAMEIASAGTSMGVYVT